MTEFLELAGGRIAYDVAGEGPLVVLAHGMGDNREAFREVATQLVAAGYRVANVDQRGHGESSAEWPSYTRTDAAADLLAVVRHLGGPAVLVGHSFAGGAATIAAAQEPELVSAIVEVTPFTRAQKPDLGGLFTNARYRRGMLLLTGMGLTGSLDKWTSYLEHAVPGARPAGFAEHLGSIKADLSRPGRMKVLRKVGTSSAADAGARLGDVRCPALVVQGSLDPDWASPRAEGEAVVAAMPAGLGRLEVIEGAGHYPHVQFPDALVALILGFLKEQR
ncbi:alpha/beta hydrolase [Lentzea sp.]|uniref:alpha/beta fold hydrolase n=1 Tax=Lentzea sp. TaxID=56099 RepID=UPI002ED06944